MKKLSAILVVMLLFSACESTRESEAPGNSEFDLVDYLLRYGLLYWEDDSMTFVYKGIQYTSRYGIIEEELTELFSIPYNIYPKRHLCGNLVFEKKELNTLYQSFCSSPFLIKITDDHGIVRFYNEKAFGQHPDPDDGILYFRVAESFTKGVFTYYPEYQDKVYSSRWYTDEEGWVILEKNKENEIYQRYQQSACRSLVVHQDKSQTLVFPRNCDR